MYMYVPVLTKIGLADKCPGLRKMWAGRQSVRTVKEIVLNSPVLWICYSVAVSGCLCDQSQFGRAEGINEGSRPEQHERKGITAGPLPQT